MGKLTSTRPGVLPNAIRSAGARASCLCLLLGFTLTSFTSVQSAPRSTPGTPKPAAVPAPADPSVAGATVPAEPALVAKPDSKAAVPAKASRYAGKDLKGYIETLAKQLSILDRATDPFGQSQDPNAKPVVRAVAAKVVRRPTAEPPALFSDIVSRIAITTIMPKEKRFYVGSRSIGQGDKLPISFRNKQIHTEVTEVSASRIVFRNIDTGEIGIRQLRMLPKGVTFGNKLTTPGMVPTNANAPLEIDSPPPPSAGTANP